MKVVQINSVCGVGSTGGITVEISKALTEHSIENYILYTYKRYQYELGIKYSNKFIVKLNAGIAKVLGNYGFNSHYATRNLIKILDDIRPDIVHIHNIHGHDLNLKGFFKHLKKTGVRVIWTLHDCWPFTGYCVHFDMQKCNKWQGYCEKCPQARQYSFFMDNSKRLYFNKKKLFTAIDDMTIVSPSIWLAQLAKHSFLGKYPIEVINNGIDLEIFKKRESDFKKRYGLEDKKVVLGVPKGELAYFIELSKILDDEYKLVLVGLKDKEIKSLPHNITGLGYLNRTEMAEVFSAADVFVNTTLADTFPTVNLEALACGTPVITFNTGGSPEAIDNNTGLVVEKHNVPAIYGAVKAICKGEDRSEACIARARELYDKTERFNDYIDLYNKTGRFR